MSTTPSTPPSTSNTTDPFASALARLDFSKPPPGWTGPDENPHRGCWHVTAPDVEQYFTACRDTPQAALEHAWAHYKARHDPPGMATANDPMFGWCFVIERRYYTWPREGSRPLYEHHEAGPAEDDARSAAWAWYERRLALADRLRVALPPSFVASVACGVLTARDRWPRCLTWSDEQVAAVERWLTDGSTEMPDVLRA